MHLTDVQIKEGDVVNVLWNDKRQYPATLLLKGKLLSSVIALCTYQSYAPPAPMRANKGPDQGIRLKFCREFRLLE